MADHTIKVAITRETIHVPTADGEILFTIQEERLDFSSPLVLAVPGWPFGPNPNRVDGIVRNTPFEIDRVTMPSYYRVVKWLFLLSDEENDLAVTSEIKALRRGDNVHFMEYAIMGDSSVIPYDLDVIEDGSAVRLIINSRYEGVLSARTSKIGVFN
ncbi:hypothetical protein [Magnetofaba australis]|uniref:Uncharacterized protein n=1 Tax=Magnetofaba australis IT-1 TaxID=1434232 RepID=A0A1Y2KA09_9PROT|nr:hypothetical protein [Magnetofaba australis]OSM07660.1 hypothetical protein MAIT1_04577 [Magnetofaba australis IT-1]